MEWTNIRIFWPKLKIMKPYLPQRIYSQIERVFTKPSPTRKQLGKIATLGESIGLERKEIVAAVDAPIPSQGAKRGDIHALDSTSNYFCYLYSCRMDYC